MNERISKELKLLTAKDIVSSYVRGEGGGKVSPEQLGDLVIKVYNALEAGLPEPEDRKVGLGL